MNRRRTDAPSDARAHVRIALAQMDVTPGACDENLERAAGMVRLAGERGADLVVLPETCDVGWTESAAARLAERIPGGRPSRVLAEAARVARIVVCAGLTERVEHGLYNSAVLFDADGRIRHVHRKINELEFARQTYLTGSSLAAIELPFARVGVLICADALAAAQAIPRALVAMGAELLISPCAWAVDEDRDPVREPYGALWRDAYVPIARQHGVGVAAVSSVGRVSSGPWAGKRCIGHSLLLAPGGHEVLVGPWAEAALLVADVPLLRSPAASR